MITHHIDNTRKTDSGLQIHLVAKTSVADKVLQRWLLNKVSQKPPTERWIELLFSLVENHLALTCL